MRLRPRSARRRRIPADAPGGSLASAVAVTGACACGPPRHGRQPAGLRGTRRRPPPRNAALAPAAGTTPLSRGPGMAGPGHHGRAPAQLRSHHDADRAGPGLQRPRNASVRTAKQTQAAAAGRGCRRARDPRGAPARCAGRGLPASCGDGAQAPGPSPGTSVTRASTPYRWPAPARPGATYLRDGG